MALFLLFLSSLTHANGAPDRGRRTRVSPFASLPAFMLFPPTVLSRFAPLLFLALFSFSASAQSPAPADTGWAVGLVGGAALTQASFDNWSGGGQNSLAYKLSVEGSAERILGRIRQTHTGQFAFGQSKIGGEQIRKIDDLLRYSAKLAYLTASPFTLTASFDGRTQVAEGFDYGSDPDAENRISAFFSPALLVESIGVGYEPQPWLRTQLGLAAKQTIVTASDVRTRYSLAPDESIRAEAGLSAAAQFERELLENVVLNSELDIFQAVLKPTSEGFEDNLDPDVRLKNLLTMKINEYLNLTGELELFYDRDLSAELQVRQTLALGLAITLL